MGTYPIYYAKEEKKGCVPILNRKFGGRLIQSGVG